VNADQIVSVPVLASGCRVAVGGGGEIFSAAIGGVKFEGSESYVE
jgi:hypothetical protein